MKTKKSSSKKRKATTLMADLHPKTARQLLKKKPKDVAVRRVSLPASNNDSNSGIDPAFIGGSDCNSRSNSPIFGNDDSAVSTEEEVAAGIAGRVVNKTVVNAQQKNEGKRQQKGATALEESFQTMTGRSIATPSPTMITGSAAMTLQTSNKYKEDPTKSSAEQEPPVRMPPSASLSRAAASSSRLVSKPAASRPIIQQQQQQQQQQQEQEKKEQSHLPSPHSSKVVTYKPVDRSLEVLARKRLAHQQQQREEEERAFLAEQQKQQKQQQQSMNMYLFPNTHNTRSKHQKLTKGSSSEAVAAGKENDKSSKKETKHRKTTAGDNTMNYTTTKKKLKITKEKSQQHHHQNPATPGGTTTTVATPTKPHKDCPRTRSTANKKKKDSRTTKPYSNDGYVLPVVPADGTITCFPIGGRLQTNYYTTSFSSTAVPTFIFTGIVLRHNLYTCKDGNGPYVVKLDDPNGVYGGPGHTMTVAELCSEMGSYTHTGFDCNMTKPLHVVNAMNWKDCTILPPLATNATSRIYAAPMMMQQQHSCQAQSGQEEQYSYHQEQEQLKLQKMQLQAQMQQQQNDQEILQQQQQQQQQYQDQKQAHHKEHHLSPKFSPLQSTKKDAAMGRRDSNFAQKASFVDAQDSSTTTKISPTTAPGNDTVYGFAYLPGTAHELCSEMLRSTKFYERLPWVEPAANPCAPPVPMAQKIRARDNVKVVVCGRTLAERPTQHHEPFAETNDQAKENDRRSLYQLPKAAASSSLELCMFHESLWLEVISVTSFGWIHAKPLSSCHFCPITEDMDQILAFPTTCVLGVQHGPYWDDGVKPVAV